MNLFKGDAPDARGDMEIRKSAAAERVSSGIKIFLQFALDLVAFFHFINLL
jgi:hypothetical protein